MLTLTLTVLLAGAAHADCPADSGTLLQDVDRAVEAYEDWAWERFESELATVQEDMGCLAEVISASAAARIHLLLALDAGRRQDAHGAETAFRGLLAVDPTFSLSTELAAPGSLLHRAFMAAKAAAPSDTRSMTERACFVDGTPGATEVPTERTAIVQLLEPGEGFSSWCLMGGPFPPSLETELLVEPATSVASVLSDGESSATAGAGQAIGKRRSPLLLAAGGVALAAAAGGMVWSESIEGSMLEQTTESRARDQYQRGLTVSIASTGVGVVGGGLVLGAVFVREW